MEVSDGEASEDNQRSHSNNNHSNGHQGDRQQHVVINVGGTQHECYLTTIMNMADTRLYWIGETVRNSNQSSAPREFFFDRHPRCFENILNYCRTGRLHCPNDVCGPLFEQELAFWGIDELMMEPCCWSVYTQHRDAHKNLQMFDSINDNQDDDEVTKKVIRSSIIDTHYKRRTEKIWDMLEKPFSSPYSQLAALISMLATVSSLITFCLQTIPSMARYHTTFEHMEYVYCAVFTFEFLLRLLCCPSYSILLRAWITYIDFMSTAQFYISFIFKTSALDVLFVSRLIRIFRLFRFFKQLSGMQVIALSLKASANELMLLSLLMTIPMVIFSTLIYYVEQDSRSIPEYFWWAIVTMTTVGYGDLVPQTVFGKWIGGMCACVGLLIVALPVSVIGSNFHLFYSYAQARIKLPPRQQNLLHTADKELVSTELLSNAEDHGFLSSRSNTERRSHIRKRAIIPQQEARKNKYSFESLLDGNSEKDGSCEFIDQRQKPGRRVSFADEKIKGFGRIKRCKKAKTLHRNFVKQRTHSARGHQESEVIQSFKTVTRALSDFTFPSKRSDDREIPEYYLEVPTESEDSLATAEIETHFLNLR